MEAARHKNKIKFLFLVICIILFWYLGKFIRIDTGALEESLGKSPLVYSGMVYVALYVIITFFIFFAKDIFWIAGAIVYGPYLSTLLIFICEVINALILFHIARYLGRNFVEHYLKKKSEDIDNRLGEISFLWLFIIRLAPLVPYRFLDLGAGLTRIRFRRYLAAVVLATPVRVLWVQYILSAVGKNIFSKPEVLAGYLSQNKALLSFSIIYFILVVVVAFKLKHKD